MSRAPKIVTLITLAALFSTAAQAQVCRVTTDGTNTGDGSDWDAQAMDPHTALGDANCSEIWVAGGIYKPSLSDPGVRFTIAREMEVYGGFEGTETDRSERDPADNLTILSGDIGNDDVTNGDGITETAEDIAGVNSNHVVYIDGTTASGPITATTVIDGFIITAGHSTASLSNGGGLRCQGAGSGNECSPTLNQIIFIGNDGTAMGNNGFANGVSNPVLNHVAFRGNRGGLGGAMYNGAFSGIASPVLNHVTFSNNTATDVGGAIYSGAEIAGANSSPVLNHVTFIDNTAANLGGAMYSRGSQNAISSPILNHVFFSINHAGIGGSAMYNEGFSAGGVSSPTLNDVTFSQNSTFLGGLGAGAMFNIGDQGGVSSPVLNNVTFSSNVGSVGTAIYNRGAQSGISSPVLNNVTFYLNRVSAIGPTPGGTMYNSGESGGVSSPVMNNVIAWGTINGTEIVNNNAAPEINDSIVEGGCPAGAICNNVIDEDPLVGLPAYHGGFTPTILPAADGAGVGAGNNATCLSEDQRGVARPQGDDCDIGAVERIPGELMLFVEVDGQGAVDAAANPAPVSGGITGCDAAGQGQPHCAAGYTDAGIVVLNFAPSAGWNVESAAGCGGVLAGNTYTTAPMLADCTVEITFQPSTDSIFGDRFEN